MQGIHVDASVTLMCLWDVWKGPPYDPYVFCLPRLAPVCSVPWETGGEEWGEVNGDYLKQALFHSPATTQHAQIPCVPCQSSNMLFGRPSKNNPKIYMEL
jgi:hypothetical protein